MEIVLKRAYSAEDLFGWNCDLCEVSYTPKTVYPDIIGMEGAICEDCLAYLHGRQPRVPEGSLSAWPRTPRRSGGLLREVPTSGGGGRGGRRSAKVRRPVATRRKSCRTAGPIPCQHRA